MNQKLAAAQNIVSAPQARYRARNSELAIIATSNTFLRMLFE